MNDPLRPNHFEEDSLGDPATCTEDHNHPEPGSGNPRLQGVPQEMIDRASGATCSRCQVRLVDSRSVRGSVSFSLYVPAVGARDRGFVCGACGLALREFLHPELLHNPVFQAVKAELQSEFY